MSQAAQYEIHPHDNPKYKFVIIGPGVRHYTIDLATAEQRKAWHEQSALVVARHAAERAEAMAKRVELMLMPYVGRVLNPGMVQQEIAADLFATLKAAMK